MSNINETFRALDNSIDEHVKKSNDDGVFVTGWALVVSLSSPSHDATSTDGYITYTSDGLPHHAQIGLLQMALDDRRNIGMLGTMMLALNSVEDNDDDEGDDDSVA